MAVPASMKALKPYLQHAKQTSKVDPLMSYHCKYYAATLGIDKAPSQPDEKAFLLSILDELDEEKKVLREQLGDPANKAPHVRQFCDKIFDKADAEDRAGNASKATARTFYAATIFYNTLRQFGELDEEVQERLKYAKWKAADITLALKEGRTPLPGPAMQEDDLTLLEESGFTSTGPSEGMGNEEPAPAQTSYGSGSYTPAPVYGSGPAGAPPSPVDFSGLSSGYQYDAPPSHGSLTGVSSQQTYSFTFDEDERTNDSKHVPEAPPSHSSYSDSPMVGKFNFVPPSEPSTQQMPSYSSPPVDQGMNGIPPQYQAPPQYQMTPPQPTYQSPASFQEQPQPVPSMPSYPSASVPTPVPARTVSQPMRTNNAHNSIPIKSGDPDFAASYRYARFAVSALQFEDVPTAIYNLKLALGQLGRRIE